jgi:hypothetical protein
MQICRLCGSSDAHERAGRLGRYALTCEICESRRGTHLDTDGRVMTTQLAHATIQRSHWRR